MFKFKSKLLGFFISVLAVSNFNCAKEQRDGLFAALEYTFARHSFCNENSGVFCKPTIKNIPSRYLAKLVNSLFYVPLLPYEELFKALEMKRNSNTPIQSDTIIFSVGWTIILLIGFAGIHILVEMLGKALEFLKASHEKCTEEECEACKDFFKDIFKRIILIDKDGFCSKSRMKKLAIKVLIFWLIFEIIGCFVVFNSDEDGFNKPVFTFDDNKPPT